MWESREVAVDAILRRKKPPKIFSVQTYELVPVTFEMGCFTVRLLRHFVGDNFFFLTGWCVRTETTHRMRRRIISVLMFRSVGRKERYFLR